MSQATDIILNDGASTPIAHTFGPVSVTPALSVFADRAPGFSAAYRLLNLTFKSAGVNRSRINRASFSISLPVVETVSGVATVTRTLRANVEVIIPDTATAAERADLYAYLQNGLENSLIKGVLRNLDPLY